MPVFALLLWPSDEVDSQDVQAYSVTIALAVSVLSDVLQVELIGGVDLGVLIWHGWSRE